MKQTQVQTLVLKKPLTKTLAAHVRRELECDTFFVRGVANTEDRLFPFSMQVTHKYLRDAVNSLFTAHEEVTILLCFYPSRCRENAVMPIPIKCVDGIGGYLAAPMLVCTDGRVLDYSNPSLHTVAETLKDFSPDHYDDVVVKYFSHLQIALLTHDVILYNE